MKVESKLPYITRQYIKQIDGLSFETVCMEVFKLKYPNAHIQKTNINDFGADLLIHLDNGRKIVVQCKITESETKLVGVKAVQEVIAAKEMYKADFAQVVTNNYFTEPAKEIATDSMVVLIDVDSLLNLNGITTLQLCDVALIFESYMNALKDKNMAYFHKFLVDPHHIFNITVPELVYTTQLALSHHIKTESVHIDEDLLVGLRHIVLLALQTTGENT